MYRQLVAYEGLKDLEGFKLKFEAFKKSYPELETIHPEFNVIN
jgi:hypothetical protein